MYYLKAKNIQDVEKFKNFKELLFLEDVLNLNIFEKNYELFYVHCQEEDNLYYQLDSKLHFEEISKWNEKYGYYLNIYGYTKDQIFFPHTCFHTKKETYYGCPKNLSIWKLKSLKDIYNLQSKIREWKNSSDYFKMDNYFDLDIASYLVQKTELYGPALFKDYILEQAEAKYEEYGSVCVNEDMDIITWKGGEDIINITCDFDSFFFREVL